MASMPGRVTKTLAFNNFDKDISANQKRYYESYDKPPKIDQLLEQAVQDGVITDGTRQHVRADWLQAYWPSVKHANRILQRGLYWATRIAYFEDHEAEKPSTPRKAPLPICSVWICTGEYGEPRFEVVSILSDYQVTVVLLTPPPEKDLPLSVGEKLQPIWGTRSEAYPEVPGETLIDAWFNTVTVRPIDVAPPE